MLMRLRKPTIHTAVSTLALRALSSPVTAATFDMTSTTDADDSLVCVWSNNACKLVPTSQQHTHIFVSNP